MLIRLFNKLRGANQNAEREFGAGVDDDDDTDKTAGSIQRNLLFMLICAAVCVAILVLLLQLRVARDVAQDSQDKLLEAAAVSIMGNARVSGGELVLEIPSLAFSILDTGTDERIFYAIRRGQDFLSGYEDLDVPMLEPDETIRFSSTSVFGHHVRIVTLRQDIGTVAGPDAPVIAIAQTVNKMDQLLRNIFIQAVFIGAVVFVVLTVLAVIIARKVVAPIERMADAVSLRGNRNLHEIRDVVPVEIDPLKKALNSLMLQLKTAQQQSHDFVIQAMANMEEPLEQVLTEAERIERGSSDAQAKLSASKVVEMQQIAARTSHQLLEHARAALRSEAPERAEVDLRDVLELTIQELSPLFVARNIMLQPLIPNEEAVLLGDQPLLSSGISNVIDNARVHVGAGNSVFVELDVQPTEFVVQVRDNGAGFEEADLKKVTKPFIKGARPTQNRGTGLGLSIAKGAAEAHGGRLEIANTDKGGACVTFYLPRP